MTEQRSTEVLGDLSLLYELSLSVGNSLDLATCCDDFLTTLMARKNLDLAAVWIADHHFGRGESEGGHELAYCKPEFRIRERSLPSGHPLLSCLEGRDSVCISSGDLRFKEIITEKDIRTGSFGMFSLGELGILKLHSTGSGAAFGRIELNQLRNVVSKFAVALEGCLSHTRVIWEISERERIEQAHQESEERYRVLYEDNPSMYFTLDQQGRVVSVNRFGASQLGYTVEELVGRPVLEVFHEDDQAAVGQQLQVALRNPGETYHWCFRKILKDGSVIWVEEFVRAVRGRVLIVCQDVTDQKLAEEEHEKLQRQVQQTQKLESLGVLAGGVAHDFNNLLTGILGSAELAQLDLPSTSPARVNVRNIEKSARHAAELCKQLLAYSGRGSFVIQPVNLNDVINEMADLFRLSVTKRIMLQLDLAGDLPPIDADATEIGQIVLNLVTNAAEAVGTGDGLIRISTGKTECSGEYLLKSYLGDALPPGEYVFLEVADTGCGMDEETRNRIFDPFFTTKFTGRGLGLAAALGIVRGHQGTINIYSEPGKGTTFKVLFPRSNEESSPLRVEPTSEDRWSGTGTILVVDDEEMVRTVSRKMLEHVGFRVWTASDGQEAVRIFRERHDEISLVLLDMTMPRLSGEETFHELRSIKNNVRVVLCSGYDEQRAIAHFVGKGLAGFVQKPYPMHEIVNTIRTVLEPS